MSRRPRQIAHKAEVLASNGSAPSSSEAAPGIDTHIQVTGSNTSTAGVAETVAAPTNQKQVIAKSGNAYTSS